LADGKALASKLFHISVPEAATEKRQETTTMHPPLRNNMTSLSAPIYRLR
jgi:hypothetical protein